MSTRAGCSSSRFKFFGTSLLSAAASDRVGPMLGDSAHRSRSNAAVHWLHGRCAEWAAIRKRFVLVDRDVAGHDLQAPSEDELQPTESDQPIDWLTRPLRIFAAHRLSGAATLLAAAIVVLIWPTPAGPTPTTHCWLLRFTNGVGTFELSKPVLLWINDASRPEQKS